MSTTNQAQLSDVPNNALLVCKAEGEYKNIGDYIQTIAASQYTGTPCKYIQRERLSVYNGEPIKLIMNGWYMHNPQNWPPSDKINPLLISMHISPSTSGSMFSEDGVKYLKKHGPVGCRDKETMKTVQAHGIPAYFSGCLTLTLGKTYRHVPNATRTIFVDPYFKVSKTPAQLTLYVLTLACNWNSIKFICKKKYRDTRLFSLIKTASFYRTYSKIFEKNLLLSATYITHKIRTTDLGTSENETEKLKYAHTLLKQYSNARLLVTSRIHAALPCIGMGTPVVFIMSEHYNKKPTSKGRFEGILDLMNVIGYANQRLHVDGPSTKIIDETYRPHTVNITERDRLIKSLNDACIKFLSSH